MEVEKIVSTVQEQVGNTDFSAQTIQKAIELFPVAEGQEPDEAYFSKVASFIKGMQGQYNHDFSTKFKEAQKNLLTKDTIKNMSDEQIAEIKKLLSEAKETGTPNESEEVKSLKEQLDKLTERLNAGDKAKEQAEMLQKVRAAMKAQKATDDYVLDNTLKGVTFDVSKSPEDLAAEYLKVYDAEYVKCRGVNSIPRSSGSAGGGGESAADRFFSKKGKREGWKK